MWWLTLIGCVTEPVDIDELGSDEGANDLVLAWVETDQERVRLRVTVDGGTPLTWFQPVPEEGRYIGRVGFDNEVVIEALDLAGETVLGRAEIDRPYKRSVEDLGGIKVSWQSGVDVKTPNFTVDSDARLDGWLEPNDRESPALQLGMSEDDLEAHYQVTGRRLTTGAESVRGLKGVVEGSREISGRPLVTVENRVVTRLVFPARGCDTVDAELRQKWGEPTKETERSRTWTGARNEASLSIGRICFFDLGRRAFGQKRARAEKRGPNPKVDADLGPSADLLPPPAGVALLQLGQAKAEVEAQWPMKRGGLRIGDVSASVMFQDDHVSKIFVLTPDADCTDALERTRARLGPETSESTHLGFAWEGTEVKRRVMPTGTRCSVNWETGR